MEITRDPRWNILVSPASGPMEANTSIGRVELLLDGPYPVRMRVTGRPDIWQYMDEEGYKLRGLPPIEGRTHQ